MHITTVSQNVLSTMLLAAAVTQGAPLEARDDKPNYTCDARPQAVQSTGGLTQNKYTIGSYVWTINDIDCPADISDKLDDALTTALDESKTHPCDQLVPSNYNRNDRDVTTGARMEVVMVDQYHRIPYQDLQTFIELLQSFKPAPGQSDAPKKCKSGGVDAGVAGQGSGVWSLGPALDVSKLFDSL